MARQEKTLTELEFQPTLDVDRGNDLIWTVDVSDKSMSAYGTSKKVKVEAFIGDKGEAGESSYSYIAYASDSSGSDFTMVFDENLDYIAIKTTTSPIVSPQASDFTGLWKNYKGGQGLPGVDGKDGKDGTDGTDGASSYTYIAYASDSSGTDFTMTFNSALDYIAIKTTSTPIVSPQALDFVGLWKNYKGATGTAATVGVGTTTTLNPGQSASVSNSGTPSAAVFDFGIPKGVDGVDGEDGLDINWRGVYDNSASYVVNDSVFYNGSSYICILNSSGNLPTNTTYWNLMAQQGSAGTGSGDVSGPSSSTDDTLARFDGVTGKLIQGSLVTVNDSGSVNIPSGEQYLVDGSPVQGCAWKGAWATSTVYALNDIVENEGSGYVCISAHTSGASTEPGVGGSWKSGWDLFVEGMGEPNITEDTTTDLEGYLYGDGSNVGVKSEQDIIDIIMSQVSSGWLAVDETWTRVSNTTFTIAGDKTDKYQKGDKIKLTQSGNVKYFYIIGIVYSSPNTTITVTGGSDYSLVSATIVDPYFSKTENPQGHPVWFDWIPTIGGVTGGSITLAKFRIIGNQVFLAINFGGSGSPAYVTFTGPLPYSPTGGAAHWAGGARVEDTSGATAGYWQHQGSNVFRVYKVGTVAFNSSAGAILQLFYEY